jgi:hypothetical protein
VAFLVLVVIHFLGAVPETIAVILVNGPATVLLVFLVFV